MSQQRGQFSGKSWAGVSLSAVGLFGVLTLGCHSMEPTQSMGWTTRISRVTVVTSAPAPMAPPVAEQPAPPPEPEPVAPPPAPTGDGVVIAKSIQDACGLSDQELQDAKFGLASTKLNPGGVNLLTKIADCVKDGKLQDSKLELVGYTDDRGSEEYNLKLGRQRAESARAVLTAHGVSSDRLRVDSKGESEATGTDEASRALDRRVEVRVAGEQ